MWRIREVDERLRAEPDLQIRVREVHPEVCFYSWAGRPMQHAKRSPEGKAERLALIERQFGAAFAMARSAIHPRLAADDDIIDAFAALWTAERIFRGEASTVPARAPIDRYGLRMEMVT
jgi:predicted RNase H-like nuclease